MLRKLLLLALLACLAGTAAGAAATDSSRGRAGYTSSVYAAPTDVGQKLVNIDVYCQCIPPRKSSSTWRIAIDNGRRRPISVSVSATFHGVHPSSPSLRIDPYWHATASTPVIRGNVLKWSIGRVPEGMGFPVYLTVEALKPPPAQVCATFVVTVKGLGTGTQTLCQKAKK
jgi:hypothetical protein